MGKIRQCANHLPVNSLGFAPASKGVTLPGNMDENGMTKTPYLDGQFLIAMPGIGDSRFERALIYVCAHSEQGAMGIIVNKTAPMMRFGDLLAQLDLHPDDEEMEPTEALMEMPVLFGGPVEQGRGFVLHTSDYFTEDSSLPVAGNISLTATVDILRAMAVGEGPRRAILALGYAGWAPGQLEDEIQHNGWITCAADEELLFGLGFEERYEAALRKLKIDPAMLSSDAGHA
jgi:putative transcriptional regulator